MVKSFKQTRAVSLKTTLVFYSLLFGVFTASSVLATLFPVGISSFTHILFPTFVLFFFGMLTLFGYIKVLTLMLGRVLIILAALGWRDQSIHSVCLVLLQLNILEAVFLDVHKKYYLNAICGIFLLASSFYLMLNWTGSYILVQNENYLLWILAYTVWNANFVALHLTGAYYLHHFLILLSPIVACVVLFDFSYWFMLRETSLLLGIAALASFKQELYKMEHQQTYKMRFEKFQIIIRNKKTQLSICGGTCLILFIQLFFF